MTRTRFKPVTEHIGSFPNTAQEVLERLRQAIRHAAPANEKVSYQNFSFALHGNPGAGIS
jgi:uncharacterized protein YdhG (YjbR/CyaY superfamily)